MLQVQIQINMVSLAVIVVGQSVERGTESIELAVLL
jgi:hypothetical protein